MVRVFIPTKLNWPNMRTHRWVENSGMDVYYCVHSRQGQWELNRTFGISMDRILVLDVPLNLGAGTVTWIRAAIEDRFVAEGEWYLMLDDDLMLSKLPEPHYSDPSLRFDCMQPESRELFSTAFQARTLPALVNEMIARAEAQRTIYATVPGPTNVMFRARKWKSIGFAACFNLTKKDLEIPWNYHGNLVLEDYARAVAVIAKYGSIVINQWVTHEGFPATGSSIGDKHYRRINQRQAAQKLCQLFPGLIEPYKGSDHMIRFKVRTTKQVKRWQND